VKTETTKKIHKPEKVLREDLADRKAKLEEAGWKFDFNEQENQWSAKRKDDETIETAMGIGYLISTLEGMIETEKKSPEEVKFITKENRLPDNTEVTFTDAGKNYEGYIFDTAYNHTTYLIKAMVNGEVCNFYKKPGDLKVKNGQTSVSNKQEKPAISEEITTPEFNDVFTQKMQDVIDNNEHYPLFAGKSLDEIGEIYHKQTPKNHYNRLDMGWYAAYDAARAVEENKLLLARPEKIVFKQGGTFTLKTGDESRLVHFHYDPGDHHLTFNDFEGANAISSTGFRSDVQTNQLHFDSFAEMIENRVRSIAGEDDINKTKKQNQAKKVLAKSLEILDLKFERTELGYNEYFDSMKTEKPAPAEKIESWAIKEKAELEQKGWTFQLNPAARFDVAADGIVFRNYRTVEESVQAARGLQELRSAGETEKLKDLYFKQEVERLNRAHFLANEAYDKWCDIDDGSDEAARLKKISDDADEIEDVLDENATMEQRAASASLMKEIPLYQLSGWKFELDDKDEWSALKDGMIGASGYNSLELLLRYCDRREREAAGDVSDTNVDGNESKPLTLEQTARISDWMEKGWKIVKGSGDVWKAEKEISGKNVTAENADIDALFLQLAEIEPDTEAKKSLKPSETLPETEIKKVRFQLTDDDVKLKTNALMDVMSVIETKKNALSEAKKQYKKDIEKLEEEQDELVDQIRSRVEYRPIECVIEYDLGRGEAIYYRPDIQEQVDRRSMTKDEMRVALAAQERAKQPELFK